MKLPENAKIEKFLPKNHFYNKVFLNQKLKDEFVRLIKKITWKYKISEETVGIKKTDKVEEIQVFEVELKEKQVPEKILKIIDKAIPYPILFVAKYGDDWKYIISLKENGVKDYYYSEWNEDIDFDFYGVDLGKVYQKLIKKFIKTAGEEEIFGQAVEKDAKIKELEKEMEKLENKLNKEKQFNRKVELNKELNNKKQELNKLKQ